MIYVYYDSTNEDAAQKLVYRLEWEGTCGSVRSRSASEPITVYGNATQIFTDSTEIQALYEMADVPVSPITEPVNED